MKKFFAILIAVAMVFTLTSAAFALDSDGSITIANATEDQTYNIYRIFDLVSFEGESYVYKVNADWTGFINQNTINGVYVSVDNTTGANNGNVTWIDGDVAEFAKLALAYAKANSIGPSRTGVAGEPAEGQTASTVTFTGLPLGYYLVDSTVGTVCSLDTTDRTVTINDKNEKPTLDKEVQEDSTQAWGDKNNAQIGDTVNFRIKVTKQAGAINYVVHDKMEAGLTFSGAVTVTDPNGVVDAANYTLTTPAEGQTALADGCTFELDLNDDYIASLANGAEIVITYSAVLNKDAEIYEGVNKNESWLKYGDNGDLTTEKDETETETYYFDLVKTNANNIVLEGAEFILLDADKVEIPVVLEDGEYRVAVEGETGVVITAGSVRINGLDEDTYYLRETKAPTGFNQLDEDVEVIMTNGNKQANLTNDATTQAEIYQSGGVQVVNNSGTELPSTGGMGTTLFYIVGAVLVAGAAIILFSRRRMAFAA